MSVIGHGKKSNLGVSPTNLNGISFIDSANYFDDYVLIDDNTTPYEIKNYNHFTQYTNPEVRGFVVPLYKRIFLEAETAYSVIEHFLTDDGYKINVNDLRFEQHLYCPDNNPIVIRLFLTSSNQFKSFRNINRANDYMASIHTNLPMPQFIWVAELSLKSLYDEEKVFGEIILDATAAKYSRLESLVMVHYPRNIGFRMRDESVYELFTRFHLKNDNAFGVYPMFVNNLKSHE